LKVAMVTDLQVMAEEYVAALRDYVDGGGEAALQRARQLGVAVLDRGAGVSDLALIGSHAVGILLLAAETASENVAVVRAASEFFAEAVSPLELTQEGFRDALETLGRLNAVLERDVSAHMRSAREAEARLARVLDAVGDAVVIAGADRCVTALSRAAEALLGRRAEAAVGRPLETLIAGDLDGGGAAAGSSSEPEPARAVRVVRPDGSEVRARATVTRLRQLERGELIIVLAAADE
jgi:PAS domain S-box-containing protein